MVGEAERRDAARWLLRSGASFSPCASEKPLRRERLSEGAILFCRFGGGRGAERVRK